MKILLTGASGFVGSALCAELKKLGLEIVPLSFSRFLSGEDTSIPNGCDVCIHLAARVHVMKDQCEDPLLEFRRCNTLGTRDLAYKAAIAGARRFVFISSIKVNGEETAFGTPFTAQDVPAPSDPYGVSKLEAEIALRQIEQETGMEVVIIRPPLIYGPGVKANFAAMMRLIQHGLPLPIGAVNNKRSIVGLGNLIDLIHVCISHPAAANQTLLVSDGVDLSTPELAQQIGDAFGRPAKLIRVPERLLKSVATLLGKEEIIRRLSGSLQVDIEATCRQLDWKPPVTLEKELRRTVDALRVS